MKRRKLSDALPITHLRLVPIEINIGQSATASWTSENCVQVTLNSIVEDLNGSVQVAPLVTTSYTLIGYAEDGTQTQETVVLQVDYPPPSPSPMKRKTRGKK